MVVGWYVIEPPETGVLAAFTRKVTATMIGQAPMTGNLMPIVPKLAAAMMGFVTPAGGINATLPKLSANLNGTQAQSGNMASLLKQVAAAMVATQTQSGSLASTLPKSSVLITGSHFNAAILAASVQKLQANFTGAQTQSGTMAPTLPKVSAAATDAPSGPMASTIKAVQASLSGFMVPQGGIASTLPKATAALAGSHAQSGSFASTMKTIQALLAAQQAQIGTMAPTLRKVSAAMLSQPPVIFDAVGAGGLPATVGFNPSLVTSWNQVMSTTGANLCCTVCIVSQTNGLAGSGQTRAVNFGTTSGTGGTAMTSIIFKDSSAGSEFFVEIFYILTSLTGTREITVTVSGGGNTGRALVANSVSYKNVGAVIAGASNAGSAPTLSLSGSSAGNEILVAAFAGKSAITPTGSNNTRYNQQASGDISNILIQDSPGTGSAVNFGGTDASGVWAAANARLQPA